MIRSELLKIIQPLITDQLVVCNIGLPSQELHLIDGQPSNFYMLGTMGLASSIGLGVALAQDKKVIAMLGEQHGPSDYAHRDGPRRIRNRGLPAA